MAVRLAQGECTARTGLWLPDAYLTLSVEATYNLLSHGNFLSLEYFKRNFQLGKKSHHRFWNRDETSRGCQKGFLGVKHR